ncbi:hypothetical protein CPAV1605_1398 [seawater metagenome]|uniref:Uncharacterized protein n=1 Tax=seawater metagenome TaxID=1561972 RepID=A0A5E8CM52_9ZZZZ
MKKFFGKKRHDTYKSGKLLQNNYVGVDLQAYMGYDNQQTYTDEGFLILRPYIGKHFEGDLKGDISLNMDTMKENVMDEVSYILSTTYKVGSLDIDLAFGFDGTGDNLVKMGCDYECSKNLSLGAEAILKFGDEKQDHQYWLSTKLLYPIDYNQNEAGINIKFMTGTYDTSDTIDDTRNQYGFQLMPMMKLATAEEKNIDIFGGFSIGSITRNKAAGSTKNPDINLDGFFGSFQINNLNSTDTVSS